MLGRHLLYQSGPPIPVGEKWTFTSNSSWDVPATGKYKITLVGAGGKGGAGSALTEEYYHMGGYCRACDYARSGSGGGGGAGQTVVQTCTLKKGSTIQIEIGKANSNPSKITGAVEVTANGGLPGGNASRNTSYMGGSNSCMNGKSCQSGVAAGTVASNYGTGGSSGRISPNDSSVPSGGAGKVSDYGNGYGSGGRGGNGAKYGTAQTSGSNGTAGICVIEYIWR
jgi:hypothetical protein